MRLEYKIRINFIDCSIENGIVVLVYWSRVEISDIRFHNSLHLELC